LLFAYRITSTKRANGIKEKMGLETLAFNRDLAFIGDPAFTRSFTV